MSKVDDYKKREGRIYGGRKKPHKRWRQFSKNLELETAKSSRGEKVISHLRG